MNEKYVNLDCGMITTKSDVHSVLRQAIGSPEYVGNNLDALYDVLTSVKGLQLNFENFSILSDRLGDYYDRLVKVIVAASNNNPDLKVTISY